MENNSFSANCITTFNARISRLLGDNHRVVISASSVDVSAPLSGWVTCQRHKTYKMLEIPFDGFPSDEEIIKAAQKCEKCIEEYAQALPPSQWPEGAEL